MNMGFTKLDSGIVNSSIWDEPPETRVLWITILAMSDENGLVSASGSGLRRLANIEPEKFDKALKTLESPDADSRTPDNEGRRIVKIEGGWIIQNFLKYRARSEIIKEQTRERVRRYREKHDVTHCNATDTLPSASVSASSSSSASASASASKTWRSSFWLYRKMVIMAYRDIIGNPATLREQERLNPNLDVKLSLEKSIINFWGTRAGWENKRWKRSKTINMKTTLINNIDKNRVFKPKEKNNTQSMDFQKQAEGKYDNLPKASN